MRWVSNLLAAIENAFVNAIVKRHAKQVDLAVTGHVSARASAYPELLNRLPDGCLASLYRDSTYPLLNRLPDACHYMTQHVPTYPTKSAS